MKFIFWAKFTQLVNMSLFFTSLFKTLSYFYKDVQEFITILDVKKLQKFLAQALRFTKRLPYPPVNRPKITLHRYTLLNRKVGTKYKSKMILEEYS